MSTYSRATAVACANIAFIKYWGDADPALHLPANSSVSMCLDSLTTTTTVAPDSTLAHDSLTINGVAASPVALARVSRHLDVLRAAVGAASVPRAQVTSQTGFPLGAGLASSAAAFAALTVAGGSAYGLHLSELALSALARRGSGSACRSVPEGYVEWRAGSDDATSTAHALFPPGHWPLHDCIAIVSAAHKSVGSVQGHLRAPSSPLQALRLAGAEARVAVCREAIAARDLRRLGELAEVEAFMLHGVAMTAEPPARYLSAATHGVLEAVLGWRKEGLGVYVTMDAGPNVHCLCEARDAGRVAERLRALSQVRQVLVARPGPGAHLISEHLGPPAP